MMTNAKRQAEGLNAVAAKVLSVLPHAEPMTVSGVVSELFRAQNSRIDFNIVHGCLRALCTSGHAKEAPPGMFRRTTVASQDEPEHKAKPAPLPANVVSLPMSEKITEREPLESIGVLAAKLREAGRGLLMWAEDLERLGLEFEQRVDAAGQDGKQLAQLRNILKNLGM